MSEFPLPLVEKGCTLDIPHFPTKMQALIFRMWDMVPPEKLALVLQTTTENVEMLAKGMGLNASSPNKDWLQKGYITIIRSAWHLIPYNQILQLLGWSREKLAYILREDDFLDIKLGGFKFDCEEILYRPLSQKELIETEKIRNAVAKYNLFDFSTASSPFDLFSGLEIEPIKIMPPPKEYSIVLDESWKICNVTEEAETDFFINLFLEDYQKAFGFAPIYGQGEKNIIKLIINPDISDLEEYHKIAFSDDEIVIFAASPVGAYRGLVLLEDMGREVGGPYYKKGSMIVKPKIKTRYIYSYCGLYGNAFDEDSKVSCPDELLRYYARLGINGVFTQAVFYKMQPYPFAPEKSIGWEKRMEVLGDMAIRAKKYGIKVYLYVNEPRAMPLSFYEKYPHLKGFEHGGYASLCTSVREVREYLQNTVRSICEAVPDLGGFFLITRSENLTNCVSFLGRKNTKNCPRCMEKDATKTIADVHNLFVEATDSVNPDIRVFAYAWEWKGICDSEKLKIQIMDEISPRVIILQVSESGMEYTIGGISNRVSDYSMSLIGPSDYSKELWKKAAEAGHETAAKVQLNNSWECSAVPYIPVFDMVRLHMQRLEDAGVSHLMLSWTLGGYPSENLKIASEFYFDISGGDKWTYEEYLKGKYGEQSDNVKKAVTFFCGAFAEFPFYIYTLYTGPFNAGVSNPLYLNPTGLSATMTCYAYDDVDSWRSIYPIDVFINQTKMMAEKWEEGLRLLEGVSNCELWDVAAVCGATFWSAYYQLCFIQARDEYLRTGGKKHKDEMVFLAHNELSLAIKVYRIMLNNPTIGYEAANHYYYSRTMLAEKIINCLHIILKLETE